MAEYDRHLLFGAGAAGRLSAARSRVAANDQPPLRSLPITRPSTRDGDFDEDFADPKDRDDKVSQLQFFQIAKGLDRYCAHLLTHGHVGFSGSVSRRMPEQ